MVKHLIPMSELLRRLQELAKMVEPVLPSYADGFYFLQRRQDMFVDKESGEMFDEQSENTYENTGADYGKSDDNEKYAYRLGELESVKEMNEQEIEEPQELKTEKGKVIYNKSGLPMIAERRFGLFGKFNRIYVYPHHEHSIIFGGSGSGKTESLVLQLINSIIDAGENAVIHDCKLELIQYFCDKIKRNGYNLIVLNYANPKYSHRWNPYSYPIELWKKVLEDNNCRADEFRNCRSKGLAKAVERIKDIGQVLCYEEDNDKNSYFWKNAASMMNGAALLLAEEGRFDCINGKGIRMVYEMDEADEKQDSILRKFLAECRKIDDESVMEMNNYLNASANAKADTVSTFRQKVSVLTMNDDIAYITSGSDPEVDLKKIYEEKTIVFILTQDEKPQYYPLVTLFLKQLYEVGVELTRQGRYKSWPYRMNWVIEEMGILPEIKDFKNIYNAARSRGLTIYGFMQSMSDMIDKYEVTGTKTILENCRMQVLVHAETKDTYDYFRQRAGKELYWDESTNNGKGGYKPRDIFTEEAMSKFEKGRILFTPTEEDPYLAKLPRFSQYVNYEKPDIRCLFRDDMFTSTGRQYELDDVPWFSDMETVTMRHKFINEHS